MDFNNVDTRLLTSEIRHSCANNQHVTMVQMPAVMPGQRVVVRHGRDFSRTGALLRVAIASHNKSVVRSIRILYVIVTK